MHITKGNGQKEEGGRPGFEPREIGQQATVFSSQETTWEKNLFGGRGGALRKSRLPLISPTSYLELSSKIASVSISTLNFLPF
jgi:hypothetical protein